MNHLPSGIFIPETRCEWNLYAVMACLFELKRGKLIRPISSGNFGRDIIEIQAHSKSLTQCQYSQSDDGKFWPQVNAVLTMSYNIHMGVS